jgi:RNA polymerase sigma-70 factor (ECF subfamily)
MPDREEQVALLRRFRDGDEAAFRILFEGHAGALSERIRRGLPAPLRRRLAVSDVLQEAHLAAFQHRARFEDRGAKSFRNWLMGIVDNKIRNAVRFHVGTARRAMGRETTRSSRPVTAALRLSDDTPSRAAMGAESKARVRAALEKLPPDYRDVLRLARLESMNLKEASEEMGRSHDAVKKLYGRALCQLKKILRKDEESRDD